MSATVSMPVAVAGAVDGSTGAAELFELLVAMLS
jgi:hypothetical protein